MKRFCCWILMILLATARVLSGCAFLLLGVIFHLLAFVCAVFALGAVGMLLCMAYGNTGFQRWKWLQRKLYLVAIGGAKRSI